MAQQTNGTPTSETVPSTPDMVNIASTPPGQPPSTAPATEMQLRPTSLLTTFASVSSTPATNPGGASSSSAADAGLAQHTANQATYQVQQQAQPNGFATPATTTGANSHRQLAELTPLATQLRRTVSCGNISLPQGHEVSPAHDGGVAPSPAQNSIPPFSSLDAATQQLLLEQSREIEHLKELNAANSAQRPSHDDSLAKSLNLLAKALNKDKSMHIKGKDTSDIFSVSRFFKTVTEKFRSHSDRYDAAREVPEYSSRADEYSSISEMSNDRETVWRMFVCKCLTDVDPQFVDTVSKRVVSPIRIECSSSNQLLSRMHEMKQRVQNTFKIHKWFNTYLRPSCDKLGSIGATESVLAHSFLTALPLKVAADVEDKCVVKNEQTLEEYARIATLLVTVDARRHRSESKYYRPRGDYDVHPSKRPKIRHSFAPLAAAAMQYNASMSDDDIDHEYGAAHTLPAAASAPVRPCKMCNATDHSTYSCPHVTCYNCRQRGHFAADCPRKAMPPVPTPPLQAPHQERRGQGPKCYLCKRFGHIARDCTKDQHQQHGQGYGRVPDHHEPRDQHHGQRERDSHRGDRYSSSGRGFGRTCPRCPGRSHSLQDCPAYRGCEICGSRKHTSRRCNHR